MIVGGAIGLHLVALLLPGDDDVAGIPAGVDDSVEVTCEGVVEVAAPLLVCLDCAVPAFGTLHVDEFMMFLLDVLCIFYLDVVWEFNTHCYVHVFVELIMEVVIIVI
jgi:hypothetical protein